MNNLRRVRFLTEALVALAAVAIAFGVWFAFGRSDSSGSTAQSTVKNLTHQQYALLYTDAVLHKTPISVLKQWPSPPYQTYHTGTQTCYEWWDKPIALYNLCFKNGILSDKAIE